MEKSGRDADSIKLEFLIPIILFIISIGGYGAAYLYSQVYYNHFGIPSYLVELKLSVICISAFWIFLITSLILWGFGIVLLALKNISVYIIILAIINAILFFSGIIYMSYLIHSKTNLYWLQLIIVFIFCFLLAVHLAINIEKYKTFKETENKIGDLKNIIGKTENDISSLDSELKQVGVEMKAAIKKEIHTMASQKLIQSVKDKYETTLKTQKYVVNQINECKSDADKVTHKYDEARINHMNSLKKYLLSNSMCPVLFVVLLYALIISVIAYNDASKRQYFDYVADWTEPLRLDTRIRIN